MIGLRRDGHVSDLGLEQHALGVASSDVVAHCHTCGDCALRLAAIREDDAPVSNPARWYGSAAMVAAVMLVAWLSWPSPIPSAPDVFRPKGSAVELQIWRDSTPASERLVDGNEAVVGDHLGFRVRAPNAGFLMLLGRDERGDTWQYAPTLGAAMAWTGAQTPANLAIAVELDEVLGTERFVALWCAEPFGFDDAEPALGSDVNADDWLPLLLQDCAQSEVRLHKVRP